MSSDDCYLLFYQILYNNYHISFCQIIQIISVSIQDMHYYVSLSPIKCHYWSALPISHHTLFHDSPPVIKFKKLSTKLLEHCSDESIISHRMILKRYLLFCVYKSWAGEEVKIMPYIAPEVVHFSGNTYTYTTRRHDSLKISNGKWMWWSQSIGGRSTLDYLIKIRGFVKGLLRKQCF